jgi:hypothetical protein
MVAVLANRYAGSSSGEVGSKGPIFRPAPSLRFQRNGNLHRSKHIDTIVYGALAIVSPKERQSEQTRNDELEFGVNEIVFTVLTT